MPRNARAEVRTVYPQATIVMSTYGLVVIADPSSQHKLGHGRNWYEEEAWLDAVNHIGDHVDVLPQVK